MEICEVQLMSLANKIHNTEINHEIDKYLDSINKLFEDTNKDELIKKFFSVEFTRFFNYYQKAKDLNIEAQHSSERDTSDEKSTRFFINVGKKDGYDWMSLKDFLREVLELGRDDVFKVDVKDSFSFFNTETTNMTKVLEFFTDFKYNGRFVNVEITENKGRDRNRNRGGKRRRSNDNRPPRGEKRSFSKNKGRRDSGSKRSGKKSATGISRPRRSRR
jgi:ATP-dependent RNA helicase DeaD